MAQHPIQIHIVVSSETFTAHRNYARDEDGLYMKTHVERDGESLDETEAAEFDTVSGAVLDAMQAIQQAFMFLRQPGEFMPELIPMALRDDPPPAKDMN